MWRLATFVAAEGFLFAAGNWITKMLPELSAAIWLLIAMVMAIAAFIFWRLDGRDDDPHRSVRAFVRRQQWKHDMPILLGMLCDFGRGIALFIVLIAAFLIVRTLLT